MSHFELDVRGKRFIAHARPGITFERPARAGAEDGAGIGSRKEGTRAVERTCGILCPHPGFCCHVVFNDYQIQSASEFSTKSVIFTI